MDDACAVTTTTVQPNVSPFAFDFGSEFIKANLPVEKRTEMAVIAQNRRMDLAQDVAERTIRLQASNADMDQTLIKAQQLSQVQGDFVIRSNHLTASGKTEITVRRHSPVIWIVIAIAGILIIKWVL